jgi:protoporphyrinogen oxidase
MKDVPILGAGIAGLGAAFQLKNAGLQPEIFEMRDRPGGHTSSHAAEGGFIFDEGPHVSFTKDSRIQNLFAESVEEKYEIIQTYVNNYWKGHWIKHPAICNLHGLPDDLLVDIIKDVAALQYEEPVTEFKNFAEWLIASYGKTFAEVFSFEYNEKYHTTTPSNMSTEWLGPRLYKASFEEVVRGALSPVTTDVHYVDHFRYPTYGGFESYLEMFKKGVSFNLNHELERLDPKQKTLHFANGATRDYKQLVSSLPLPEIIRRIDGVPDEVQSAAQNLACSICVAVSVGIDRSDISNANWTYFYDQDIIFTRTSLPHLLSPKTGPEGTGSIQCEVYFSNKYKPVNKSLESIEEQVVQDLLKCGLIKEDDTILCRDTQCLQYANVIFDLDRARCVETVHGYLNDLDIHCCGRFGEWGYHWTDESFTSGERAAERALSMF